jgi:uncharacterized Fe-S cluster-containing radical SAM superfamily enzyme
MDRCRRSGFRLDVTDLRSSSYAMALSGDQNLRTTAFTALAEGVDLLVMPMAIGQVSTSVQRTLHATPRDIGSGRRAGQGSPLGGQSFHAAKFGRRQSASEWHLAEGYHGEVVEARDLLCLPLRPVLYQ